MPRRSRSRVHVRSQTKSTNKSPGLNHELLRKHGIVYKFGDFRRILGYSAKGNPITKRGESATKEELQKLGIKANW